MTSQSPHLGTPDPHAPTDANSAPRTGRARKPPPRPRWVNAFVIALVVVIVLFMVLHLAGVAPMHR